MYVLPALVIYAVFVLWPLGWLVALSLMRWDGYGTPVFIGLGNYADLWADPGFADELGHSLIWLGVTLVVPAALGLALALLLERAPAWMRGVARALWLAPLLLPTVVIAVGWRLLYNPLSGPIDRFLRLVGLSALAGDYLGDPNLALGALLVPACWASFGLSLLVCGAALRTINRDIIAAAQVDGAGGWARLRYITLPLLRGALPLAVVATALCAVPSLDLVLLTTNGGPGYATTTLPLDMYGRAFGGGGQVGAGAALAALQMVVGLGLAGLALVTARGQERAGDAEEVARRADSKRLSAGRAVAFAGVCAVTGLILLPLLWLIVVAPRAAAWSADAGGWEGVWHNVDDIWSRGFGIAFAVSGVTAAAVCVLTVLLAVPAAFALAGARHRMVSGVGVALAAVGVFQPQAVLVIPLFTLLNRLHIMNPYFRLIVPESARVLPLAVLLLWVALRRLPADVLAAAQVDGAAPRHILRRVAVPLILPTIAAAGVWAFLSSWNEYLLPTVMVQDDAFQTVPTVLGHFIGRVDTEYGLVATGSLLASVPLLALCAACYGGVAIARRRMRMTVTYQ